MTNPEIDSALSELKKIIIDLINDAYITNKTGVFLSQIGLLITKNPDFKKTMKEKKLADFIETELSSDVQIISPPESPKLKIALPKHVRVDNSNNFVPVRDQNSGLDSMPRYNKSFWAAFSHPLADGCHRYIKFDPEIYFEDNASVASLSSEYKKIPPEFIISWSQGPEESPAQISKRIAESINRWLAENHVDIDLVKVKSGEKKSLVSQNDSLLDQLISALDEADLKRIQIPLDIIVKLQRKR